MRPIDADALVNKMCEPCESTELGKCNFDDSCCLTVDMVRHAPTIDVVSAEKYDALREAFVDYICCGASNPAPYCKNKREDCVDKYGYCTYTHCRGFNPDGGRDND